MKKGLFLFFILFSIISIFFVSGVYGYCETILKDCRTSSQADCNNAQLHPGCSWTYASYSNSMGCRATGNPCIGYTDFTSCNNKVVCEYDSGNYKNICWQCVYNTATGCYFSREQGSQCTPCNPDDSCKYNTCVPEWCQDSCGNWYAGVKDPGSCLPENVCDGVWCQDVCGNWREGTKDCSSSFILTLNKNPSITATILLSPTVAGNSYTSGTQVTATLTSTQTGYTFTRWSFSDSSSCAAGTAANICKVSMDKSKTLTANFISSGCGAPSAPCTAPNGCSGTKTCSVIGGVPTWSACSTSLKKCDDGTCKSSCVQCLSNKDCPTGQSCKNNVCTDLRCNGVKANKLAKKELCLVCDGRGGLLDVNYMNGLDCGNGFCFSGKCIKYYSLAEYNKKCPSNSKSKEDVILDERQCCETSKTAPITCSHEPDASCTSVYISYDLTWLEKKLVGDANICKIKECNSPKKPVDCSKYGSGTCCPTDQICSHYGSGNKISPACGYSPEEGCPDNMEQCGDKTEEGNFVCCKKNIEKCETNFGRGRCLIISCDKNQFLCKGQNYFIDDKQQNVCCKSGSEFCFHSPNGLPLCSEIPKEVLDGSVEIAASPPVTKSITARIIDSLKFTGNTIRSWFD